MADNTVLYGKWYFNETIDYASVLSTNVIFNWKSEETLYNFNQIYSDNAGLVYVSESGGKTWVYSGNWAFESARTIVITSGGNNDFLTWLQANATKLSDSIDIEGSKPNKTLFKELMNELNDVINDKAKSSGQKALSEIVETAKSIELGITPSGTKIINSNGNHNVKDFEFAEVNVESEGIIPSGTLVVSENGNYDVTQYAKVSVVTPVAEGETRSLKKVLDLTKNASNLFKGAASITTNEGLIDFSDTSNVTIASSMFYGCYGLTTFKTLDTSSLNTADYMFYDCSKLTSVTLDTSNVTIASSMFYGCSKLTSVTLDTSKIKKASSMFYGCSKLTSVTLDLISIEQPYDQNSLFNGCKELTNLTLYNIKWNLTIGYSTTYGTLLTIESLLNTCQECINVNASRTLTVGTTNITKLADVYVKLTGEAEVDETLPKLPMVQCESTDEGAMLVADYMALKNWSLA